MNSSDAEEVLLVGRRLKRLREELSDEGVQLIESAFWDDAKLDDAKAVTLERNLLDEVMHARYPPVHEGRRPSYGALLLPTLHIEADAFDGIAELVEIDGNVSLSRARSLSNGRTSFLVRSLDQSLALAEISSGEEITLVERLPKLGALAVQRLANGSVKFFARTHLYVWENDEWSVKPYAHLEISDLVDLVQRGSTKVGGALLDISLHLLSARHIGATLVWLLDGQSSDLVERFSRQGESPGAELNVVHFSHAEILATVLASVDGACVIEQDGTVAIVEVHLGNSARSMEVISPEHGTRHTSAKRFSFDENRVLVFVVSQDGPVTVFSDGMSLLELGGIGAFRASVVAHNPSQAAEVSCELTELTCSRCMKALACEVTTFEGWNEVESVSCPICGEPNLATYVGVDARVIPVKPWGGPPGYRGD